MDAKDYLQQISMYDELIANKRWELQRMLHAAEGMTSYSETVRINGVEHALDKVQSSGSLQRMADTVCSYVDMERIIEASIIEWERERQAIISTIQTLPWQEYKVLHLLYVRKLPMKEAAAECHMSYSWTKGKCSSGLERVQQILDARGG